MTKKPNTGKPGSRDKDIAEAENKRYRIAYYFVEQNGKSDKERDSLRAIAKRFGYSHTQVKNIRDMFTSSEPDTRYVGGKTVKFTIYHLVSGIREKIKIRKPGPEKGANTPIQDRIRENVIETKKKYPYLGSAKIGILAGAEASAPTVHKVLRAAGFENVTMKTGKTYTRFEMDHVNESWQIDFVELGTDPELGCKIEFLSVLDEKSRMVLSDVPTSEPTTETVLNILENCISKYGKPERILSDHGCQWSHWAKDADVKFDDWCEKHGIKHAMGAVRHPQTQGKVERWHGTLRREGYIESHGSLEYYENRMVEFVDFYNTVRPHWAIGLSTPASVFYG